MTIRATEQKDLSKIARIHKERFPDHFLGNYSVFFLSEFYKSFLEDSIFLVAVSDDKIAGFVLGGDTNTLNQHKKAFIRKHFILCFLESAIRPRIWFQAWKRAKSNLFKKRQNEVFSNADKPTLPPDCILSIAVSKSYAGKGLGKQLTRGFEEKLPESTLSYRLSVQKDNPAAIGFYHNMGFVTLDESGDSLKMIRILPKQENE